MKINIRQGDVGVLSGLYFVCLLHTALINNSFPIAPKNKTNNDTIKP